MLRQFALGIKNQRTVDLPLRSTGKGHWAAVRALAYKWIRILFACWKNKVAYDDAKYLEALRKSRSPLIALMETASEAQTAATTS